MFSPLFRWVLHEIKNNFFFLVNLSATMQVEFRKKIHGPNNTNDVSDVICPFLEKYDSAHDREWISKFAVYKEEVSSLLLRRCDSLDQQTLI